MVKIKSVFLIFVACLFFLNSIKPRFGGSISIRLNEPDNFSYMPSNYSNHIFYSLIYENFFYLGADGAIRSNIFSYYSYDDQNKQVTLRLNKNLSFSNGDPVTPDHIKNSLRSFLSLNLDPSGKLGRIIKDIQINRDDVTINLNYNNPDIIRLLTTPQLILNAEKEQVFSGPFYPFEWDKGKVLTLKANPFYAGGRTYLDSIRVLFYDIYYPEVFLGKPGQKIENFTENKAGIYQNVYLCFPEGNVGQNTRVALYFLIRDFFESQGNTLLNSLTSDSESPVSINIMNFSKSKVRSILRSAKIKLYVHSSLKAVMTQFDNYLRSLNIPIETIFISSNQLQNDMQHTSIRFLLIEKIFNQQTTLEEKIQRVIKEMSFSRFNENYLALLNQLSEVSILNNEEMLLNHVAKIIETVIKDGFILPIYQMNYCLYNSTRLKGMVMDYYGRPIFHQAQILPDLPKNE